MCVDGAGHSSRGFSIPLSDLRREREIGRQREAGALSEDGVLRIDLNSTPFAKGSGRVTNHAP